MLSEDSQPPSENTSRDPMIPFICVTSADSTSEMAKFPIRTCESVPLSHVPTNTNAFPQI
jgi:hypothetical protein